MQKPGRDVLVKKYSNRRLYDTAESRYITMEELAQTIRSGRNVRVVDAKTHEDLTQQTLTQVILESGRAGRLLPIPLLHQLIRMDDDALAEFFGRYVSWALEMYMSAKSGAQALSPLNPFATLPFAATNAFARFFSAGPGWNAPPPPEESYAPPPPVPTPVPSEDHPDQDRAAIADLRREIEALKQAMGKK
jgi:polyhydroxyalkanoate synthesis repressor PhaR